MSFYEIHYPPIPKMTARVARFSVDIENIYFRVGSQVDELIHNLIPQERLLLGNQVGVTYCLYSLISAFQFAEKLPDSRMVDALQSRIDLKLALHLPLNYPRFNPQTLCEFRQQVMAEPLDQQCFQELVDRLNALGMFAPGLDSPQAVQDILIPLCASSNLEKVVDAFFLLIINLERQNPYLLRKINLTHWSGIYNRSARFIYWPNSPAAWELVIRDIQEDFRYLLDEIQNANRELLASTTVSKQLIEQGEELYENFSTQALTAFGEPNCWVLECSPCGR